MESLALIQSPEIKKGPVVDLDKSFRSNRGYPATNIDSNLNIWCVDCTSRNIQDKRYLWSFELGLRRRDTEGGRLRSLRHEHLRIHILIPLCKERLQNRIRIMHLMLKGVCVQMLLVMSSNKASCESEIMQSASSNVSTACKGHGPYVSHWRDVVKKKRYLVVVQVCCICWLFLCLARISIDC